MDIENYIYELIEEYENNEEEVRLGAICEKVKNKFSTKCVHTHVGEYDSPGYSIDCYAIAFIDENGEVVIYPYNKESY